MRFSIASAVLANSLAIAASSPDEHELENANLASDVELSLQAEDPKNQKRATGSGRASLFLQNAGFGGSLQSLEGGRLKKMLVNRDTAVECSPHSGSTSVDTGILSCGDGQYCMESAESSLGGFCADIGTTKLPGRRRQQVVGRLNIFELADLFCNRPEESGGLTVSCECDIDFAAYTGSFSCYFGPDCTDFKSGCGEETFPLCSTENLDGVMFSRTNYTYTSCYTQTMPLTGYRLNYCTEFGYTSNTGPTCAIDVEGQSCNSCEIDVGGGETYGENCERFDCSNTALPYVGDRCSAFSNPTLRSVSLVEYLYESVWPCENGCNLCGDGGRMTNGNNNVTYDSQFLQNSTSMSCYDFQYDALTGAFADGEYCNVLPALVEDTCGCYLPPTLPPVAPPTENPAIPPTDGGSAPTSPPTIAAPPPPPPAAAAAPLAGMSLGTPIVGLLAAVFTAFWTL